MKFVLYYVALLFFVSEASVLAQNEASKNLSASSGSPENSALQLLERRAVDGKLPQWTGAITQKSPPTAANVLPNFEGGVTTLFIGKKRGEASSSLQEPSTIPDGDPFLVGLSAHITHTAKTLAPLGLKGYLIWTNGRQEIAFMNWESDRRMTEAFNTPGGKSVASEAGQLMESVHFGPVTNSDCISRLQILAGKEKLSR